MVSMTPFPLLECWTSRNRESANFTAMGYLTPGTCMAPWTNGELSRWCRHNVTRCLRDYATWQQQVAEIAARRSDPGMPKTWPQSLESQSGVSSSFINGDCNVPLTVIPVIGHIFGGRLKNRQLRNQKTEFRMRCKILNHLTKRGMPKYR